MEKASDWDKIGYLILDVFIIIGIGICGYEAITTYYTHSERYTHSYSSQQIVNNASEGFLAINFTADVFSVQNPIDVSASFTFDNQFLATHPFITKKTIVQLLIFDSRPIHPTYSPNGDMFRPPMNLTWNNAGMYTNSTTVIFDLEGDKCFDLKPAIILVESNCVPTEADSIIHISSVDSLLQLKANKTNLTLTWVLVAFTIVAVRSFAKDMIQNLLELINKYKNKKSVAKEAQTKPEPTKNKGKPN